MKSRKLFEIAYIFNFLLFAAVVVRINIRSANLEFDSVNVSISAIISFAAFFFDWACYVLYKVYKSGRELSRSAKVIGTFAYVLFTLLTLPVLYNAITTIVFYFQDSSPLYSPNNILYHLVFWCLFSTSVYLNIMYWVIRKQIKMQQLSILSNLGENEPG
jgi:hypothetical protein